MLITGIKSKPVYAPLQADARGRFHLMVGMGVGAAPLLRVIAEMKSAAPQSLQRTRVLFVPDDADAKLRRGSIQGRGSRRRAGIRRRARAAR